MRFFDALFRRTPATPPPAAEPVLPLDGRFEDDCVAQLSVEVRLDDKGQPPTVVPLLSPDATGKVRTLKGDLIFDEQAQKDVLAKAADWGNDYCFDYAHAMVAPPLFSDPALTERAAGWYRLKLDGANLITDGLSWTKRASQMLSDRELRYVSPAVRYDAKTKRVTEFINAALTNLPATKGMRPLVASRTNEPAPQETSMLKNLISLLGLSSAATEDDALAQAASLASFKKELVVLSGKSSASDILDDIKAWKTGSTEMQELKREAFALSGKDTFAEVTADVKRWKEHSDSHAKMLAKKAAKQEKKAKKKLKKIVAKAIAEERLPPSLEQEALEAGRKGGVDFLEKFLASFEKVSKRKDTEKPGGDGEGAEELSKEEREVCSMLGLKPEAYAAMRKAAPVSVSEFSAKDDEGEGEGEKKPAKKDGPAVQTYAMGSNGAGPKVKATTTKDA